MNLLGLFLNDELRTGGHRRYLDLMERLAGRGHRVVVLLNELLAYEPRAFEAVRERVRYFRRGFPPASGKFRAAALRCRRRLLERLPEPQVLVVFGETHLPAAASLASTLGIPVLYSHRSNSFRDGLAALRESLRRPLHLPAALAHLAHAARSERMIARVADVIVFQSGYDLEDFVRRRPAAAANARIVRGDIRSPRFRPEVADSNRSTGLHRILFLGTFGERKGVRDLLRALTLLPPGVAVTADVAGPGEQRRAWELYARVHGLETKVKFAGRVADPFPLIAGTDLVVVPSLFDSYPNVILEALHAGTPVIASRVGGIPDMLCHDELLFPPADAEALAARIELLSRDRGAYQRVRALCAGRRSYFDFDWAAEFEKLAAEALARPRVRLQGAST